MYKLLTLLLAGLLVCLAQSAPPQSALDESVRLLQAGQGFEASKVLLRLCRLEPRNKAAFNLLGIAEAELGHLAEASRAFERALNLDPDFIPAEENYGLSLFRQADFGRAKKHLAHALALGSTNTGAQFSYAVACLRSGDAAGGLAGLQALEPRFADNPSYWEERALADQSAASFDRALALNPQSVRLLNSAALRVAQLGDLDHAVALLQRARAVAPDDTQTLVHFGEVCLRRNLAPDALAALERAYQLDGANNLALYLLASAHIAEQDYENGYRLFTEFSRRVPAYPITWFVLGSIDMKLGRTTDARRNFEHSVQLAGRYPDALVELGQLDIHDGRLEAAAKRLAIVLADHPDHPKANVAQADLLTRANHVEEAQACLERAIMADPKLAPAHYKLAMLLYRKQDKERADRERDRAAELTAQAQRESHTIMRIATPADGDIPSR